MNTDATAIRVRGPQDLLAYVPFRLGFRPSESVVVVSLRGRPHLVGLVARLELEAFDGRCADGTPAATAAAEVLAEYLAKDAADRVVVVGYTGAALPGAAGDGTRVRRAVEAAATRIERQWPGTESWIVTPGGYRALDCEDPLCCPPEGRPVDDITHSRTAASMVLAGRSYAASRDERLAVPRAAPEARRSAGRAALRWERRVAAPGWTGRTLDEWRTAVRRTAAAEPGEAAGLEPVMLGRLAAGLAERRVRDAVLLWLTGEDDDAVRRTAAGPADAETDAAAERAMTRIVDPQGATRPDDERVVPAVRVLEAVVAHVPRARQVAPLTLLGIVAWWSGDGAMASGRLAAALTTDGGYTLAKLVRSALDAGLPPGWVRRETAELRKADVLADTA